jgi:4-amino-4-deoxy-L-arabinose transferase-like glycosyltransferase
MVARTFRALGGAGGWPAIVLAALALRVAVAFVWLGNMPLVSDAADYSTFARELLSSFPATRAYDWPPGEALVLAGAYGVLGQHDWVARLVTVLLGTALVPLVGLVAREIEPRGRTALVAAMIAAAYPPAVLLAGQPYAQHLGALCLIALAYAFLRALRRWNAGLFVAAGAAFGLGCITRPSMVSVAAVLVVAWGWSFAIAREGARTKLVVGGAIVAVAASVFIAPVLLHNRGAGAGMVISTNNERNLFLGNNPYTPSYKTSHLGQRSLEELPPETRAYLESVYSRPHPREAMQHEALAYMAAHPLTTAYRSLNRATSFWGFDYLASLRVQIDRGWSQKRLLPMLAIEAGGYLVVMLLAVMALFGLRDAGDGGWRKWLVAVALAYEVPYVIAFSGGTYHFPVVPLLMPLAALGATRDRPAVLRALRGRGTLVALAVFAAIQIQYAYFALLMKG